MLRKRSRRMPQVLGDLGLHATPWIWMGTIRPEHNPITKQRVTPGFGNGDSVKLADSSGAELMLSPLGA